MKFTVFDLNNTEVISSKDDVTLQLSYDHLGVLRWQVIDNANNQIVAKSCRLFYIVMDFAFCKGAR